MSLLDDVASYLTTNTTVFTVGGTTGNLSLEQQLDTQPDTLVTLLEQPGLPNAYAFSTGNPVEVVYERPNMQVLSRSTDPVVARSRVQTVYRKLDGLTSTTINGIRYYEFVAVQAPFQIGRDDNQRHLWSLNFNIKKAVATGFADGFDGGFG
jgi:hypothetical protein